MNIALIDLNHMTLGVHTNTAPLGMGAIGHYLKTSVEHPLDIRMFKNPVKFLDIIRKWHPDVLGFSQYSWNSELNLHMAHIAKKANPNCVIETGGPNLYVSSPEKHAYLKKNSFIDVCVKYDGEIPFSEIVKRLVKKEKIEDIRRSPVAGTYSIDPASGRLVQSREPDPRLNTLDAFGPMYAEGFFDSMLDEGFHPFLQTQRGCPFRCTYCHTGNMYSSKVIFQSLKYFRQDMEYLAGRFAGQHNVTLYLANTNFGLFKKDMEIAAVIRETQDRFDWPKNINVNTPSDPDKISELNAILKYKTCATAALQTLTPHVLKNIKRKNISLEKLVAFHKEAEKDVKERTSTELILNLPGETRESFLKGTSKVLDSGVQNIAVYTLMSLRGTSIASRETAEQYGHVIKHRLVPRCFSNIDGDKLFETEEVVVGTKTMPYKDYLDLRGLSFVITAFANSFGFYPIRKFMSENGLNIADWIYGIHKRISLFPNLYSEYRSFMKETEKELFPSRDALVDFFTEDDNYKLLCEGKLGDNLLRKYKARILSHYYRDSLELAFSELRSLYEKKAHLKGMDKILDDLKFYLESRDVGHIFKKGYEGTSLKKAELRYDVVKWLEQEEDIALLKDQNGRFSYSIVATDYMRNRLKDFIKMNRQRDFSVQILYRDGYIKDFWPMWVKK